MTSSPLRIPLAASVTVLAAALALAGCSAGGSTASSAGGSGGSSAASAAASGGSGSTGSGSGGYSASDPCSIASTAQLQSAIDTTPAVTVQGPDSVVLGSPICVYTSDDTLSVDVMIGIVDPSKLNLQTSDFDLAALTPVSGIGDKAAEDAGELDVISGSHGIAVASSGKTKLTSDQLTAAAKLVISRLG